MSKLFENLPNKMKNPKNFKAIEEKINSILKSDHKHKTVKSYMTCAWCQEKYQARQNLIKKLGFKDFQEYQQWKQIIRIMSSKLFNENKTI